MKILVCKVKIYIFSIAILLTTAGDDQDAYFGLAKSWFFFKKGRSIM